MTLVNPLPWIQRARRERSAIGAFNANTLEQVQAIVIAAQAADPQEVDPRKYLGLAREPMIERVRERIQFFGASGKAA